MVIRKSLKKDPRHDEYEILDLYHKNKEAFFKILHKKCGNIFEMRVQCFMGHLKQNCSFCKPIITGIKNSKTNDEFIEEINRIVGSEYTVIGAYINNKCKITFRHNVCNKTFDMSPNQFLSGNRCPNCAKEVAAKKRRKSGSTFKKEVEEFGYFKLLSEYKNDRTKATIFSKLDNAIYEITPSSLLQRIKKGKFKSYIHYNEEIIYNILSSYSNVMNLQKQVTHNIDGHQLKFDFRFHARF